VLATVLSSARFKTDNRPAGEADWNVGGGTTEGQRCGRTEQTRTDSSRRYPL